MFFFKFTIWKAYIFFRISWDWRIRLSENPFSDILFHLIFFGQLPLGFYSLSDWLFRTKFAYTSAFIFIVLRFFFHTIRFWLNEFNRLRFSDWFDQLLHQTILSWPFIHRIVISFRITVCMKAWFLKKLIKF